MILWPLLGGHDYELSALTIASILLAMAGFWGAHWLPGREETKPVLMNYHWGLSVLVFLLASSPWSYSVYGLLNPNPLHLV